MVNKVYMLQCRVDTDLDKRMTYIPEYINSQDTTVEAELHIPVEVLQQHMNIRHAADKLNEVKMDIVAKRGRATMFALHLNESKEMTFQLDDAFIITDFMWGADNRKTLRREIANWDWEGKPGAGISTGEGRRPEYWNQAGSNDYLTWQQMIDARRMIVFNKTHLETLKFGFATVVLPEQYKSIITTSQ